MFSTSASPSRLSIFSIGMSPLSVFMTRTGSVWPIERSRSWRPKAFTRVPTRGPCARCVTVRMRLCRSERFWFPEPRTTQIYEGTNQVQRIVMARQLLAGVQSEL